MSLSIKIAGIGLNMIGYVGKEKKTWLPVQDWEIRIAEGKMLDGASFAIWHLYQNFKRKHLKRSSTF